MIGNTPDETRVRPGSSFRAVPGRSEDGALLRRCVGATLTTWQLRRWGVVLITASREVGRGHALTRTENAGFSRGRPWVSPRP